MVTGTGDSTDVPTRVENTITGAVAGPIVQAGAIHGGIHLHQNAPLTIELMPRQLLPTPQHFTNRAAELAELDRIADGSPGRPSIAVICGPGGVGKTALALHWLHSRVDRYPDGQLYVDLGMDGDEEPVPTAAVLGRFLRALGVASERVPADAAEAAGLFRSVTSAKRVAVLVDNVISAAQVLTVVPASSSSMMVVTSRWRLGELAIEGAGIVVLDPLQPQAAAELLTRAVGQARTHQEPHAVTQLAELCGGLPLALSIVGARLATRPRWQVAWVVQELADEQRRLSALSIGRDLSVSGVFDLSYSGMPIPAAQAYRWLSLHPGPNISPELGAAVLQLPAADTIQLLGILVDACLLTDTGTDRYRFHDLVRLHARQRANLEDCKHSPGARSRM